MRQSIINFFRDREAVTMVRPCEDEHDLRRLNSLPDAKIRPEFLKATHLIKEKILNKCTPKQLNGVNLTSRMFVAMLQRHIDALNSGELPNIATAWEYVLENECVAAYNDAVEVFNVGLKENFMGHEEEKTPKELAQESYDAAKLAYESSKRTYETDLKAWEDKLKKGQEKVDELSTRFAGWYYVISSDSFEKFRITRNDVVSKKEEEKPAETEAGAGN